MSFLDRASRAQFKGLDIPYVKISIHGMQRHQLHKYPYIDLADIEKLGRDPYVFRISGVFDENMSDMYPDNFPGTLGKLQKLYEANAEETLILPRMGHTKAWFSEYEESVDSRIRSGATTEFSFIEAPDRSVVFSDLIEGVSFDQIESGHSAVLAYVASLAPKMTVDPSLLARLKSGIDSILAMRDKGELYTQQAQSKLLGVTDTIKRIDAAITQPVGYKLVDALRDLWQSCTKLVNDASLKGPISQRKTPKPMTIQQVAIWLYNDTSRVMDLLKTNDTLPDAMAIDEGTTIFYFP